MHINKNILDIKLWTAVDSGWPRDQERQAWYYQNENIVWTSDGKDQAKSNTAARNIRKQTECAKVDME